MNRFWNGDNDDPPFENTTSNDLLLRTFTTNCFYAGTYLFNTFNQGANPLLGLTNPQHFLFLFLFHFPSLSFHFISFHFISFLFHNVKGLSAKQVFCRQDNQNDRYFLPEVELYIYIQFHVRPFLKQLLSPSHRYLIYLNAEIEFVKITDPDG